MGSGGPLQVNVQPCLCGAGNARGPDYAMVCNLAKGKATLRHDLSGSGAGYNFVPLAMESCGYLRREAARFLSDLGDIAATDGRVCEATFV